MKKSLELRRDRARIVQEMQDLTRNSGAWNTHTNGGKSEAEVRWHDLDARQKQLQTDVYRAEADELGEEMDRHTPPPRDPIKAEQYTIQHRAKPEQQTYSETRDLQPFVKELSSGEYRDAFTQFLRGGTDSLNTNQRNMLTDLSMEVRTYAGLSTSTSGDAAGYTVPIGFQRELETALKAVSQLRANARILATPSGNVLDWPTMDDTGAEGEFVAEAVAVNQLNPSFGQIQFASYLCSSKQVLASVQLVQDSAFDVQSFLVEAFSQRIGRRLNRAYTSGTGSGEPQGLVYSIQNDAVPNVVKATGSNSNDGVSGNTEANSVGSDDLENLIAAVDPLYRPNAKFMMASSTIDALRKTKDKYGRPIWNAGLSSATPDTIFGYGFFWNQSMDAIGANKYPVAFGDFSKFVIRDSAGFQVKVFSELYMVNHQYGYMAWLRSDSRRLQQKAFSLLWNPLS